jgi:hypothetical protein
MSDFDKLQEAPAEAVAMFQDIETDPGNSTTARIRASATFTGQWVSTLGMVGIKVHSHIDQQHTIVVEQSEDGANAIYADLWSVPSDCDETRIIPALASYCRIKVTNDAAVDASAVCVQTRLYPVFETAFRSLIFQGSGGRNRVAEFPDPGPEPIDPGEDRSAYIAQIHGPVQVCPQVQSCEYMHMHLEAKQKHRNWLAAHRRYQVARDLDRLDMREKEGWAPHFTESERIARILGEAFLDKIGWPTGGWMGAG